MSTEYFTIRNWRAFQHYKDRSPPWIKLHFDLLQSRDWVMLDDASRVLAVACMLIASRNDGRVPNDPEYMKRVAYLHTCDFNPLIKTGFLECASNTLAPASKRYSETDKSTDKSTEGEKKKRGAITPTAENFPLTDELIAYANSKGVRNRKVIEAFHENFLGRCQAGSGKTGKPYKYHDPVKAWQNWLRDDIAAGKIRPEPKPVTENY